MKKDKIRPEELKLPIVEVSRVGEKSLFKLSSQEIKHLRRCLRNRMLLYPSVFETDDNLTRRVLNKLLQVGKLVLVRNKSIMKNKKRKCSFEGCKKTNSLEVHHENPISNAGENSKENLVFYCTLHHNYVELKNHLKRKKAEVKVMEEKILSIEKRLKF